MTIVRAIIVLVLAVTFQACAATSSRTSRDSALRIPPKPALSSETATAKETVVDSSKPAQGESSADQSKTSKVTSRRGSTGQFGLLSSSPPQEKPHTRESAKDAEKQKVLLNFDKADIAEVTNQIFGEYLKLNYVADPTLQGRISMFLEGEYSKEELFQLVSKVYEANNVAVVFRDGIYYIQPIQRSTSSSLPLASSTLLKEDRGEAKPVIVIYRMRYMDVTKATNVIKPFLSPGRPVVPDTLTNSIIFVENVDNAQSILNVIKALDINVFQELSMEIVPVQSIAPQDAAQGMEALVNKLFVFKESSLKNNLAFIPLPNFGGVLILAQNQEVLREAKSWLTALDMQGKEAGEQIYVYFAQNALARDIADVLTQVYGLQGGASGGRPEQQIVGALRSSTGGTSGFGSGTFGGSSSLRSSSGSSSTGGSLGSSLSGSTSGSSSSLGRTTGLGTTSGGYSTFGGGLSQGRTGGLGRVGTGRTGQAPSLTGEVVVIADEVNNALVIRANAADYARIKKTIETLDIIPRAVLIEVTVAEIKLTDDLKYGLEYYFKQINMPVDGKAGTLSGLFHGVSSGTALDPAAIATPGIGMLWASDDNKIGVLLNLLSERTEVNVLSTPTLLATDNKEASIVVGGREPVPTGSYSAGTSTTTGVGVLSTISYEETGVILNVIPHINAGGLVRLEVDQTVRRVQKESKEVSPGTKAPVFDERNIKTTLMAQSGSTVVIGGIIQQTDDSAHGGIPFLKDVPVIGPLFTSKKTSAKEKIELIVAITPHVIETRETEATREFLDKLKNLKKRIQG